jgi:hypothetical protein
MLYDQETDTDSHIGGTPLYEIFFTDGTVEETDGLIWKDILREGDWAYRPGPGQKPIPVPLKVVAGKASSQKEIGMADLIESFDEHVIDHVTIPTSHDDKPHENTGYVKGLRKVKIKGKYVLKAGLDFTEPDIKAKAQRGSIANTSSGIMFDYIKKDTGKTYTQVLGHVALTNKPWLNGMQPFGVAASENYSEDEIVPLMLESSIWDESKSLNWLRDNVSQALSTLRGPNSSLFCKDIMQNRALVAKVDELGGNVDNFVVPFKITDGDVELATSDKWIAADQKWVQAAEKLAEDFIKNFDSEPSNKDEDLSETSADPGAEKTESQEGEIDMAEENKNDKSGTPSDSSAGNVDLSEIRKEIAEEIRTELSEEAKAEKARNAELSKEVRTLRVDKRVGELKEAGLSENPGFLTAIRDLMLADEGTKVLKLSETDAETKTTSEVSLSATEIIERLIDALPHKDDKIVLGEQAVSTEDKDRPALEPEETDLSEEGAEARADKIVEELELGNDYKSKDGES